MRVRGIALVLALCLATASFGCQEEGPAERAGETIDEAAEDTGEAFEDMGREIGEAADEAKDAADEMREGE